MENGVFCGIFNVWSAQIPRFVKPGSFPQGPSVTSVTDFNLQRTLESNFLLADDHPEIGVRPDRTLRKAGTSQPGN
jgi:hypothetical protein